MKHPDHDRQKYQEEFLQNRPSDELEEHAILFRVGNAAYRYHQLAKDQEPSTSDYKEWLEGLPPHIRKDMESKGFKRCMTIFSFTRFVNERRDIGMDEWMKQNLSREDYADYRKD